MRFNIPILSMIIVNIFTHQLNTPREDLNIMEKFQWYNNLYNVKQDSKTDTNEDNFNRILYTSINTLHQNFLDEDNRTVFGEYIPVIPKRSVQSIFLFENNSYKSKIGINHNEKLIESIIIIPTNKNIDKFEVSFDRLVFMENKAIEYEYDDDSRLNNEYIIKSIYSSKNYPNIKIEFFNKFDNTDMNRYLYLKENSDQIKSFQYVKLSVNQV